MSFKYGLSFIIVKFYKFIKFTFVFLLNFIGNNLIDLSSKNV